MSRLKAYQYQLIIGDFNKKKINWDTMSFICSGDSKFIEMIQGGYFTQHVEAATRGRGKDIFSGKDLIIEKVTMSPPL